MITPLLAASAQWSSVSRCSSSAARANLAKTLLYAINGGVDEKLKIQVGPKTAPLMDEVLDYDTVDGEP
ncbi:keto-acid formate acetyltransferase [Citrobacter koseri]|uniref:Keto-acid formate acetyltransferase n=1 Tax=Citrobacter koseri TaxID=545 RepID=A0A2X2WNE4_CITKO|nr:keto-acid formate acetyltransferase [Citrobacter koseri]